jgi:hypothetical protein
VARGQSDEVMILTLSCIDLPRLLQALKTINVQRRALHEGIPFTSKPLSHVRGSYHANRYVHTHPHLIRT